MIRCIGYPSEQRGEPDLQMRKTARILNIVVISGLAAWCVVVLHRDISRETFGLIWRSWDCLGVALGLSALNYCLRSVRWWFYLRSLRHQTAFGFSALTYIAGFAFTLSPGKLGEVVRAGYYVNPRIPLREVAAAVGVERTMDLLAMLLLATLILSAHPSYATALIGAAVMVAVVLFSLRFVPWRAVGSRLTRIAWLPRSALRVLDAIAGALGSARELVRPWPLTIGLAIGLTGWGLEGIGVSVLSSMFGLGHLGVPEAIGIYAVSVLVGAILFLPGGVGGTEAAMTTLIVSRGYSVADALLITLACRVATLWFAVLLGWLAVGLLRLTGRSAIPESA